MVGVFEFPFPSGVMEMKAPTTIQEEESECDPFPSPRGVLEMKGTYENPLPSKHFSA